MEMFKSRSANFAVIRAIIVEASKCTEIDVLRDLEELVYEHVFQFDFSACEIKEIYRLTVSHTSGVFANFISNISRNENMHKEAYYTAYKFAISLCEDNETTEIEMLDAIANIANRNIDNRTAIVIAHQTMSMQGFRPQDLLNDVLKNLYNNHATDTNTRNQINAYLVLAA